MTTQTLFDFKTGLPPVVVEQNGTRYKLAINKSLFTNNGSKTEMTSISVYAPRRGSARTIRIAPSIASPDSTFLSRYAERGTEELEGDERLAEYRKHLVATAKHLLAGGLAQLPDDYTMENLESLKGFRWNYKAGCACGCSPAFNTPLLVPRSGNRASWCNVGLHPKPDEAVTVLLRMTQEQAYNVIFNYDAEASQK
jgi:hypothetical protein